MGQQNRHYQRLNCQWSTINDEWLGRIMHLLGFNNHQHSTFNLHKSSIGFSITHVFSCLEVPRQVRCELCSTDKNSSLSVFIFFSLVTTEIFTLSTSIKPAVHFQVRVISVQFMVAVGWLIPFMCTLTVFGRRGIVSIKYSWAAQLV